MKPINAAQRSPAFIYFLILFLITTALVVLAVFGMQVPFRQNERLEQQVNMYESERTFADRFSAKATFTKILLDSVNRAGVPADILNGQISGELVNLNAMIDRDTSGVKKIYQDIVRNLFDLQTAKTQLREASNKDDAVRQYLQQIEDLRGQLSTKTTEADQLRMQIISLSHQ